MMQFLQDTQVAGRFFPRGAQVQIVKAGTRALVLPDPGAHTTLCAVAMESLAPLRRFRVLLANHQVGLVDEQERFGLNEADVLVGIASSAPNCDVVAIDDADDPR